MLVQLKFKCCEDAAFIGRPRNLQRHKAVNFTIHATTFHSLHSYFSTNPYANADAMINPSGPPSHKVLV